LGEFYHIYHFGSLGEKYELIRFLGSKVVVTIRPDMVKNGQGIHIDGSPWVLSISHAVGFCTTCWYILPCRLSEILYSV